jgi:hypothetical protein
MTSARVSPDASHRQGDDSKAVKSTNVDHTREMRHMGRLIKWLDTHEHWWLRELRWRDQGRID